MLISNDRISSVNLFRRYEYKYLISPELVDPIRKFLLSYCYMDPFAQKEPDKFYTVQNLYLDSADYRTYWDAQEEAPSRFKLRFRSYGSDPAAWNKFEIKRRLNDVCYKTSVKVRYKTWPEMSIIEVPHTSIKPHRVPIRLFKDSWLLPICSMQSRKC